MSALQVVRDHLSSVLPAGVPPSYSAISSAVTVGSGRKAIARATLIMFDGLPATVEVFGWGAGCRGHRWTEMAGGAAYFENGKWQRDTEIDAAASTPTTEVKP